MEFTFLLVFKFFFHLLPQFAEFLTKFSKTTEIVKINSTSTCILLPFGIKLLELKTIQINQNSETCKLQR